MSAPMQPAEVDAYVVKARRTVRAGFDRNMSEALVIVSEQLARAESKVNSLADERDRLRAELAEAVALLKRAADIMSDAPDDLNGHGEWADDFAKYRYAKYRDDEAQKETT